MTLDSFTPHSLPQGGLLLDSPNEYFPDLSDEQLNALVAFYTVRIDGPYPSAVLILSASGPRCARGRAQYAQHVEYVSERHRHRTGNGSQFDSILKKEFRSRT